MATYYSQGSDLWSTLTNWDTNAGGGGSDPASVAAMDANIFIIQAGHAITMDVDMSAFAGITSLLIKSDNTTPGTLLWKDGTSGILKIVSGAAATNKVYGDNSGTKRGRLLANLSGLWTGSTTSSKLMAAQRGETGAVSDGGGAVRIFTPTISPAWVVDALIGESMTINGTTYAIEDNDATTVTLTTGPAVGVTVTAWALVVRPLPVDHTARIMLGALSSIQAQYLDILLYHTEPTIKSVRTYGTTETFTADAGTDVLTLATTLATILTANVPVYVSTAGTLPAGLTAGTLYYVRTVSGATCKLSTTASDAGLVDITDAGTGIHAITTGIVPVASIASNTITCTPTLPTTPWAGDQVVMFTSTGTYPSGIEPNVPYVVHNLSGATFQIEAKAWAGAITLGTSWTGTLKAYIGGGATTLATMAVLDDVTGDTYWQATGDTTTWATCTTRSAAVLVDAGPAGGNDYQRLAIKAITPSTITFNAVVDSAQFPNASIFLVSRNVSIWSETTTNYAIVNIDDSNYGGVLGCEIRGRVSSEIGWGVSYQSTRGAGFLISGTISGMIRAVYAMTGGEVSGLIAACSIGINNGVGTTISGMMAGCADAVSLGFQHRLTSTGVIWGCGLAFTGSDHDIGGLITFCTLGSSNAQNCRFSGTIAYCNYIFYGSFGCIFTPSFRVKVTSAENFRFDGTQACWAYVRGWAAPNPIPPTFTTRPLSGGGGSITGRNTIYFEDYNGVPGAMWAAHNSGDVTKQASIVRAGGAASALQVVPGNTCGVYGERGAVLTAQIRVFEWTELAVAASSQTKSVYVRGSNATAWSVYPTAKELYFEAEYLDDETVMTTALVRSTAVLTDNTTWTQFSVTFEPGQVGPVRYRLIFGAYEAGAEIYVDNQLVTG